MKQVELKDFAMRVCVVILLLSGLLGAGFCLYTSGSINSRFAELDQASRSHRQDTADLVRDAVAPVVRELERRDSELRHREEELVRLQRTLEIMQQCFALHDVGASGGIPDLERKLRELESSEGRSFLGSYQEILESELRRLRRDEEEIMAETPRRREHMRRMQSLMEEELRELGSRERNESEQLDSQLRALYEAQRACTRALSSESLPTVAHQSWLESLKTVGTEITALKQRQAKLSEDTFGQKREILTRYLIHGIEPEAEVPAQPAP